MGRGQYCLTLNLHDDEELIAAYEKHHRPGCVWPEVLESIRASGIENMQIYRAGTLLVMVLEANDSFSFEAKADLDRVNVKVQEWEALMGRFQKVSPDGSKWKPLSSIFQLKEDE